MFQRASLVLVSFSTALFQACIFCSLLLKDCFNSKTVSTVRVLVLTHHNHICYVDGRVGNSLCLSVRLMCINEFSCLSVLQQVTITRHLRFNFAPVAKLRLCQQSRGYTCRKDSFTNNRHLTHGTIDSLR